MLQRVAACCSVLQCVAACCNVLQCLAVCYIAFVLYRLFLHVPVLARVERCSVLQRVAACCSVLQRVAACCSVLQCIAACCSFYMFQYSPGLGAVSPVFTCVTWLVHICNVTCLSHMCHMTHSWKRERERERVCVWERKRDAYVNVHTGTKVPTLPPAMPWINVYL